MTTLRMLMGVLVAQVIGWLIVTVVLPHPGRHSEAFWLRLPLALGAGLGVTSLNYFLWMPLAPRSPWIFTLGELSIILGLGAYLKFSRRRTPEGYARNSSPQKSPVFLMLSFWLISAWAFLNFTLRSFGQQHGNWDAWAIWNLAARFLYRGGEQWRNAFSPLLFHGDYPLLIPASVSRLWSFAGKESLYASWMVALAFFGATIVLLLVSIRILRGGVYAMIGGLVLVSATAFTVYSAAQIADVPTGFYTLASVVLILPAADNSAAQNRTLVLAGFFAGLAAWTKNEGWLICAALGLSLLLVCWSRIGRSAALNALLQFAAGAAPVLVIVAIFKIGYAPPNDLLAGQDAGTLARLFDPTSYWQILESLLYQLVRLDVKTSTPLILVPIYLLILGLQLQEVRRPGFQIIAGALLVVLAGYFFIFLLTPNPLDWQLEDPPPRLFLHLWPSVILLFVLALPELFSTARKGGNTHVKS